MLFHKEMEGVHVSMQIGMHTGRTSISQADQLYGSTFVSVKDVKNWLNAQFK